MNRITQITATAVLLLVTGCAYNRCPECGEPGAPVVVDNSNTTLYRECVASLPLEYCSQQLRQWIQEDQLNRLEQQNTMMLQNQNVQMFNYWYNQSQNRVH